MVYGSYHCSGVIMIPGSLAVRTFSGSTARISSPPILLKSSWVTTNVKVKFTSGSVATDSCLNNSCFLSEIHCTEHSRIMDNDILSNWPELQRRYAKQLSTSTWILPSLMWAYESARISLFAQRVSGTIFCVKMCLWHNAANLVWYATSIFPASTLMIFLSLRILPLLDWGLNTS